MSTHAGKTLCLFPISSCASLSVTRTRNRTQSKSLCAAISPPTLYLSTPTAMRDISPSSSVISLSNSTTLSETTPASPPVADMAVSARAALSARPLLTLPAELRNRIWGFVLHEDYPSADGFAMDCKRLRRGESTAADFKASLLRSNLRVTPVVRQEYLSLLWASYKTICLCSCNTKASHTLDLAFLHFPHHPRLFSINYHIHPGTMRNNALAVMKPFVRNLIQMGYNGTINLSGVRYEAELVQFGLRFLHELFKDGCNFKEALDRVACLSGWKYLSTMYGRNDNRTVFPGRDRYSPRELSRADARECFPSARDAALAAGMSAFEAQEAGKDAREAYRKSLPKVLIGDYGIPDGVKVEHNSVQLEWDLSGVKVEGI
ncbi:hypothetical protein IWX90DRAFT_411360 [Phyllosticta citrichinensis]|uniref:Uncharacterized protein n=1 Tax=Phyllosticta citrichinensis TaxID=1130410 RepID=A0ABR1Y7T4_9PEZI